MGRIDQFSRILHHRISTSGQTFTVPTSDDHTDETWISTDLYIGELGINISDDKIYMRTNNGIVQIATGTSSGGSTSSVAQPWTFTAPNISISSTYSADAILPRSGYYTDLGSTSLRWKDLYLGGSSTGYTTINTNGGLILKDSANNILTTNNAVSSNASFEIYGTSSNILKDRALHINSRNAKILGTSEGNVTIGSNDITMTNSKNVVAIGARDMTFSTGITSSVMIGYGYGKNLITSNTVAVGGQLNVRGISDDGTFIYVDSDWKTSQNRLTTTNATTTTISQIAVVLGDLTQIRAFIIGGNPNGAGPWFAAEVSATGYYPESGTASILGTPTIEYWRSDSTLEAAVTIDNSAIYIKVKGKAGTTLNWLSTYSYHRMVNLTS